MDRERERVEKEKKREGRNKGREGTREFKQVSNCQPPRAQADLNIRHSGFVLSNGQIGFGHCGEDKGQRAVWGSVSRQPHNGMQEKSFVHTLRNAKNAKNARKAVGALPSRRSLIFSM